MLSVTLITERALICVISLSYESREIARAKTIVLAHVDDESFSRTLNEAGYQPYRLGVQSMRLASGSGAYARLLDAIQNSVDPREEFLPPSRYTAN